MTPHPPTHFVVAALGALALSAIPAFSQVPAAAPAAGQGRGSPQAPAIVSPEVSADRHITFRLSAPQAQAVRLSAGDIPALDKATDGVMFV